MTETKQIKNRLMTSILITGLIILILIATSFSALAALNTTTIRNKLWAVGGISTMTNTETLTLNALLHYGREGVFGTTQACYTPNATQSKSLNQYLADCEDARDFYNDAKNYGEIVEARMSIADPTGARVDKAMDQFSDLADVIFSFMVAFGQLTALLVFTIQFMKIAWAPSHAIDRRKMILDIATSGVSIMLLGNIWLVMSLFQSCFNRFWQTFAVYSKDWKTVAHMVLVEYKGFIVGLSGIATLLVLAMFVINFTGLALDGAQANKRAEKTQKLLQCSIAAAGLGSITLIVGFFWNLF
jgi:hypothetical protein